MTSSKYRRPQWMHLTVKMELQLRSQISKSIHRLREIPASGQGRRAHPWRLALPRSENFGNAGAGVDLNNCRAAQLNARPWHSRRPEPHDTKPVLSPKSRPLAFSPRKTLTLSATPIEPTSTSRWPCDAAEHIAATGADSETLALLSRRGPFFSFRAHPNPDRAHRP